MSEAKIWFTNHQKIKNNLKNKRVYRKHTCLRISALPNYGDLTFCTTAYFGYKGAMKSAAVNLDVGHVWQGGGFKFDQKQKGKSKSLVNRISIAVQFTNVNEGDEFLVILSVH